MKFTIDNINEMCLSLLKEIGNIGSGNAATSLAKMINKKVDMEVPNVEVVETQNVVEMFADPEEVTVGVYINFTGDIQGTILTLLDRRSSDALVKTLIGTEPQDLQYNDMELSVVQELGNIMTSGYVNAISMFSNLLMNISVPSVCVDMVSSILSVPAIEYGLESDQLILIENKLDIEGENVNCYFFFMPNLDSFETLFVKLGVLKDE